MPIAFQGRSWVSTGAVIALSVNSKAVIDMTVQVLEDMKRII